MQEKRAYIRALIQAAAFIADASGEHWDEVSLLDISRVGIAFNTPMEYPSGTTRMLRFELPGVAENNEGLVQLVHCSDQGVDSGYRVGARFVAIDDETRARIEKFVHMQT